MVKFCITPLSRPNLLYLPRAFTSFVQVEDAWRNCRDLGWSQEGAPERADSDLTQGAKRSEARRPRWMCVR